MPGRPQLQALDARIQEMGGDDAVVFDAMRDGKKPKEIAADLGVSKGQLYHWRDYDTTGERARKWSAAMRVKVEVELEDGGERLDALTADGRKPTSAEVQAAKEQANWRMSMAKVWDPERFDRAALTPANTATLLLEALMAVGTHKNIPAQPEPLLIPAEIIDEAQ